MGHDDIAFEKVTIAEASAVLRGAAVPTKDDSTWAEKRSKPQPSDLMLMDDTREWLRALPPEIKPVHLTQKFPRIVNKICGAWRRPEQCLKIFDELMMDRRGTRQGFPIDVVREITHLRVYYTTEVYKMKPDTWTISA
jgi:hypothetical protein